MQSREICLAWERMPALQPRLTLEIFSPSAPAQMFYLGPHAPSLTPREIDLLHKLWLDFSEKLPEIEIHHHDIVHFALEFTRSAAEGREDAVLQKLREHVEGIRSCHTFPESVNSLFAPSSAAPEDTISRLDPKVS